MSVLTIAHLNLWRIYRVTDSNREGCIERESKENECVGGGNDRAVYYGSSTHHTHTIHQQIYCQSTAADPVTTAFVFLHNGKPASVL